MRGRVGDDQGRRLEDRREESTLVGEEDNRQKRKELEVCSLCF